MAELAEIVRFLDRELNTAGISDYPGAWNGLQVANDGEVHRVIAAVDASWPVIEKAAEGGPGLLIVHHGLFWQGVQPVTGAFRRKLKTALNAGLAIYSSHLPLDVHPEWGNNRLLADAIGLRDQEPFLPGKSGAMGIRGTWQGNRESLAAAVGSAVGGPVHVCPAGPEKILTVGLVTGGAGSEVAAAAAAGIDAFVTGEGPHWSYTLAEEVEINVLYAGHYATETFGVRRLLNVVSANWGIPNDFIHHPTGL
ncbi:MAG: Nif3-like dinuclear metal center hexameric protein [Verrucomicrobiota bacterium]